MSNGFRSVLAGTVVGKYLVSEELVGKLLTIKRSAEALLRHEIEEKGLRTPADLADPYAQQLAAALADMATDVFDDKVRHAELLEEVTKFQPSAKPEGFLCPYMRQLSQQFMLIPKNMLKEDQPSDTSGGSSAR